MSFKDHFSSHSAAYAKYRPDYPPALFAYLASLSEGREYALDCATGSGQAAVGLAGYFECVIATDGSVAQLQHAAPHERVRYVANLAERPAFRDGCFDLIAAAQAAHWFDHERFYAGVRRVLRPDGVLALWTYGIAKIEPTLDARVHHFYSEIVGPYWPPERRHVESAYRALPFPLAEITAPTLELEVSWDLDTFIGYVGTWSATQRYTKTRGVDPLPALRTELASAWGDPATERLIVWPLHLRVGRL
jgi:SAM-dependent methyltransferase